MALCIECGIATYEWKEMKKHYKENHPEIKRPDKFFVKSWRDT